ncbi:hypothetical protein [uncultured Helicobacter sp.]
MEETSTKLTQVDYAMLVQYGVDSVSDEEIIAQAELESEYMEIN